MIVSPTQAERWMICPTYWDLYQRWQPKEAWNPAMAVGTAIHLGIAKYHAKDGDPLQVCQGQLEQDFQENKEYTLPQLLKVAARGLSALMEVPGLVKGETVVAVETPLQEYGGCIPDLVSEFNGTLIVTDYKTSIQLSREWATKRLQELWPDYQLLHNAWAVSQVYGKRVGYIRRVLVVCGPKPEVFVRAIPLTTEGLRRWVEDALFIGHSIQTMSQAVILGVIPHYPRTLTSCYRKKEGQCAFWSICWELEGNESGAEAFYDRRGA